ncbi:MAG: FAD-binding oxidoreductase [Gammaproteobacteria bacterium]|nr:MAG: FAD-binding oxidoreductase [Gammaproteobacteria bacterium]
MNANKREVTVLGGGIVGVACALYLQRDGHTVTLIDRGAPGDGCSRGNAGIFATEHVMPLATPGNIRKVPRMLLDPRAPLCIRWRYLPRMLPWLWRFASCAHSNTIAASARALAALQSGALAAYGPLLDQAQARELVRAGGWMCVYESEKEFRAGRFERDLQRHHGIRVEELTVDDVRARAPAVSRSVRRGVLFPDSAYTVNPHRLVQMLAADFRRRGGIVRQATVNDVEVLPGQRTRVHTDSGPHETDAVVVALGAWSGQISAELGSPVPLETERGYHVTLPQPGIDIGLPIMFGEHRFFATPLEHGLRLAGTVELASLDAPPNYTRARVLLAHARRLLPRLQTQEYSLWMGCRPTLPDSLPVIGRSPRHRNVYFAFGHQHLGLTLAGITGRLVANQLAGRKNDIDLTPYRIDRF